MDTDFNIDIGDISSIPPTRIQTVRAKIQKKAIGAKASLLMRVLKSFAFTSGLIYGLLCLMILFFQDSLIYNPSRTISNVPMVYRHSFVNVILETSNKNKISAWYIAAKENRGSVLFCQGNKGNMSENIAIIEKWNQAGYNILIFDYQGYGLSQGEPSEKNCYADANAAYTWLREAGMVNKNFIIHGRSIGGAVAAKLASEVKCNGLILESTFTSLKDLAHTKLPYLPTSLLLLNDFPVKEYLNSVKAPVMIMHSAEDEVIPYRMTNSLISASPRNSKFFQLTGNHANGYKTTHGYISNLKDFAEGLKTEK